MLLGTLRTGCMAQSGRGAGAVAASKVASGHRWPESCVARDSAVAFPQLYTRNFPSFRKGIQRLAATPHPLFLQRTLVSRKRAKIGARAGPIWHYAALRGTRRPLHVRAYM